MSGSTSDRASVRNQRRTISAVLVAAIMVVSMVAIGVGAGGVGAQTADNDATGDDLAEYNLTFAAGEGPYGFGSPVPTDQTFNEVFDRTPSGTLYVYDKEAGQWKNPANNDNELDGLDETLSALDGYALSGLSDSLNATIQVQSAGAVGQPAQREVSEGYNIITPTRQETIASTNSDPAFQSSADITLVLNPLEEPTVSPSSEDNFDSATSNDDVTVNPFAAYWAFAEDDGVAASAVTTGASQAEADAGLEVDTIGPEFGSLTSPSDPTSETQPTITVDGVSDATGSVDASTVSVTLFDSSDDSEVLSVSDADATSGLTYDSDAGTISLDLSTTSDTLSDGTTYDVEVAAADDSSNSNSKTIESAFTVDTAVEMASDPVTATADGSDITVTVTANEELVPGEITVANVDGQSAGSFSEVGTTGESPYEYEATISDVADGSYTVDVTNVEDAAGNTLDPSETDTAGVTVDTTGPEFGSLTSPSDPTSETQPTITVDGVSDATGSVDASTVSVTLFDSSDDSEVLSVSDADATSGLTYDSDAGTISLDLSTTSDTLSDGTTYDVEVAAADDSSNSNSKTIESAFTVDTAGSISGNVELAGDDIPSDETLTVTVSDGGSEFTQEVALDDTTTTGDTVSFTVSDVAPGDYTVSASVSGDAYLVTSGTEDVTVDAGTETSLNDNIVVDDAAGVAKNVDTGTIYDGDIPIQSAITDADPEETIKVYDGTYDESVTIDTEGLTLEGADGAEPVINGSGANNAVVAAADNVTIRGFQVEGFKERGIWDYDTEVEVAYDGTLIEDNVVTDPDPGTATVQAIQIDGDNAQVIDNTVAGVPEFEGDDYDSTGILAESTDNAEIRNNTVEVNDLGIAISTFFGNATGNTIEGNDVSSTNSTGIQVGTNTLEEPGQNSASDTDIIDNTVEDSATGLGIRDFGGAGISGTNVSDNDFVDNEVHVNDPDDFVDLDAILNDQGNTFDPAGEVVGDQIRVEGTAPADTVVNLDTGATFTGTTAIQDAVDNASSGNTLRVGPGTFTESVTIDVEGLTLEAAEGANPTVTQSSGSVVDVNANDVTVDGLTVEAGDGTFAVNLDGVSDAAAVTLTDNTIDLTAGNDASVGIVAGSGSSISETIESNTFQANPDNFLGDGTTPSFVDDGNDRVDFGTILSENTFEPGVVEYDFGALAAAVPVDSNDEFLQALADDRDAGDGTVGGPFALSKSYTDGLDNQSIAGQRDAPRGTVRVDIDPADINTDNSYSTPDGDAISGVFINGFDQAAFQNVIISGGQVFIFVPDRLSGEQVTIAVGNFDQTSNPSGWDGLSGDDIVIQNVTIQ